MLPVLETKRLRLRPFGVDDAQKVQMMAGDYELYKTTLNLPYPYELQMAYDWIETHERSYETHHMLTLAIVLKEGDHLLGAISLGEHPKNRYGEIGYWIGREYWGNGYGTEASEAVIAFGFSQMKLNKVMGRYFVSNPASARIMEKCGMEFEGIQKEVALKNGVYHDIGFYGLTRVAWLTANKEAVQIAIRRARPEDSYALSQIQREAFLEDIERYGDRTDCPANEPEDQLKTKIQMFDYYVFLENDRVIGGADVRQDAEKCHCRLSRIYVHPAFHNLGIGRFVLKALEDLYPDAKKWSLDTPNQNHRNHHFYLSHGYKKVAEKVVDEGLLLFEYEKHL